MRLQLYNKRLLLLLLFFFFLKKRTRSNVLFVRFKEMRNMMLDLDTKKDVTMADSV